MALRLGNPSPLLVGNSVCHAQHVVEVSRWRVGAPRRKLQRVLLEGEGLCVA